jgi:CRISPR/Cas system endoribonuclease Cas6 (RAMP superfamily)
METEVVTMIKSKMFQHDLKYLLQPSMNSFIHRSKISRMEIMDSMQIMKGFERKAEGEQMLITRRIRHRHNTKRKNHINFFE